MALVPPPDGPAMAALERRVGDLCDRVIGAEAAARRALDDLLRAQAQRYEDAVHFVYANLVRGAMHGDRLRIQACLFAGCNTLEQLQTDWNTGRMDAQRGLLTAADNLRTVATLLSDRFGLGAPASPTAGGGGGGGAGDDMDLDLIAERVGHKRRRVEELRAGRERGAGPHANLVDALRDPAAAFGTGLSASEHRLLSTILPECALMPDLTLLRDAWHPNLCLYSTDRDRRWSDVGGPGDGMHVSTFCGLILSEFLRTRRDMQRFTFVHILTVMGFGPTDVNHYLPFLEQTFYDRLNCDPALCFIPQAHAPPVKVYRGAEWADLLDLFAAEHIGVQPDAWEGAMMHHVLSRIEARLCATRHSASERQDALALTPTTVLGALHRLRTDERAYLDDMGEAAAVEAMDDAFGAAVARAAETAGHAAVAGYLAGGVARARAWPMSLRQMAVEHVRSLVRRLRLVPRCPDLPAAAGVLEGLPTPPNLADVVARTTAWMWRFRWQRGSDDPDPPADAADDVDDVLESELRAVVASMLTYPSPSVRTIVAQVCTEMDEAAIRAGVEAVYGGVTEDNRAHMATHLGNMESMVSEAFRHDQRLWTERRRRRIGMDPVELLNDFAVAAGAAHGELFRPDDLRVQYMRAYRRHADDTILDADAALTGYGGMRDPALFPPPPENA